MTEQTRTERLIEDKASILAEMQGLFYNALPEDEDEDDGNLTCKETLRYWARKDLQACKDYISDIKFGYDVEEDDMDIGYRLGWEGCKKYILSKLQAEV